MGKGMKQYSAAELARTMEAQIMRSSECPHCEYDRRFPGFEAGGWVQQDNNGPIVSCPVCNPDGSYPRMDGAISKLTT
jgi:hypothetical protein